MRVPAVCASTVLPERVPQHGAPEEIKHHLGKSKLADAASAGRGSNQWPAAKGDHDSDFGLGLLAGKF